MARKEINPEYQLEGLMLKLKLHYFGHLMGRADSLEKTLMLGKIEDKRQQDLQRRLEKFQQDLRRFQIPKNSEPWR